MTRYKIDFTGYHGGPLDEAQFDVMPGDDLNEAIRSNLMAMIPQWVIEPGDTITVKEVAR